MGENIFVFGRTICTCERASKAYWYMKKRITTRIVPHKGSKIDANQTEIISGLDPQVPAHT